MKAVSPWSNKYPVTDNCVFQVISATLPLCLSVTDNCVLQVIFTTLPLYLSVTDNCVFQVIFTDASSLSVSNWQLCVSGYLYDASALSVSKWQLCVSGYLYDASSLSVSEAQSAALLRETGIEVEDAGVGKGVSTCIHLLKRCDWWFGTLERRNCNLKQDEAQSTSAESTKRRN